MPWCETCAKFWNPNSMAPDGSCPTCGRPLPSPALGRGGGRVDDDEGSQGGRASRPKVPWHFWVMVSALALYIGFRLLQGVGWLVDWAV